MNQQALSSLIWSVADLLRVPISRIFRNEEFGYRTITVERKLRDEAGKLKGKQQPDSSLRDTENVPLSEDVEVYFQREVLSA
jgi:type I restriction enzyme M protein